MMGGTMPLLFLLAGFGSGRPDPGPKGADLAEQLRALDTRAIVLGTVRQQPLASMLARDVQARLRAANRADSQAWQSVRDRASWERFRDERLRALRASLGQFPEPPKAVK